jgi:hypothetical protein
LFGHMNTNMNNSHETNFRAGAKYFWDYTMMIFGWYLYK